jgi:hypothetical protein
MAGDKGILTYGHTPLFFAARRVCCGHRTYCPGVLKVLVGLTRPQEVCRCEVTLRARRYARSGKVPIRLVVPDPPVPGAGGGHARHTPFYGHIRHVPPGPNGTFWIPRRPPWSPHCQCLLIPEQPVTLVRGCLAKTLNHQRKQCRPLTAAAPRYRPHGNEGRRQVGSPGRANPADTNAVRASSQNGFCAHPIARDHSQHQKTTQFWLLFGPWFHTIEPQFIRMLGIIWGKETRGLGCADLDDGARKRRSWSARFRSFVQHRGRFWLSAKLRGQQS